LEAEGEGQGGEVMVSSERDPTKRWVGRKGQEERVLLKSAAEARLSIEPKRSQVPTTKSSTLETALLKPKYKSCWVRLRLSDRSLHARRNRLVGMPAQVQYELDEDAVDWIWLAIEREQSYDPRIAIIATNL